MATFVIMDATGNLFTYLKEFSKAKISGFDILQPLLDKANIMTKAENISYHLEM